MCRYTGYPHNHQYPHRQEKPEQWARCARQAKAKVSKHKELVSRRLCDHPSVLICDILVTCDQGANVSMLSCVIEIDCVILKPGRPFCGTIVVLSEQSVTARTPTREVGAWREQLVIKQSKASHVLIWFGRA